MEKKEVLLPQEWPGIHYLGEEEADAATRVIRDQSPFRYYGPALRKETLRFEEEFARFIGVKHCLAVASGTTALQVALLALDVGFGDEVIIPGYFWISTVGAVIRTGAIPVLADVDESFAIDPEDLKKKISERTKAVILVHMGGIMGKVEEIRAICQSHHIPLMEDCAQAAGVTRFGQKCGSFGDISIFSFQINKNMTAGEGGAVVTNSKDLYLKSIAAHDLGYPKDDSGAIMLDDPNYQAWGIGVRLSEIASAVLRAQLKKLPEIINAMCTFKNELKDLVLSFPGTKVQHSDDPKGDSGGFLKITFDYPDNSWKFKEGLIKYGIKTKHDAYYPIHMEEWGLHIYYNIPSLVAKKPFSGRYSVWDLRENGFAKDYQYGKGTLPNLDKYVESTVLFCVASILDDEQKQFIKEAFEKTLKEVIW
jgi:8-amino-3,8-dideoxy-alpha-D-manno-octulosonate transaminase